MRYNFKYIYGPVPSWRLGSSLGIDLLSQKEKICNFDCIYCQLGATKKYVSERKTYISIEEIVKELKKLPDTAIDYVTFSGRGEPGLAANLGEAIKAVKLIRKEPVAVLTNSSLIGEDKARKDFLLADFVVAKLDACSSESLKVINNPAKEIKLNSILEGIKEFRKSYQGRLALQMMFIESNMQDVDKYVCLANEIKPDEVQINTPLRFCNVKPLTKEEISKIKYYFGSACKGIDIFSVYDKKKNKGIVSISDEDTLKRRGKVKL